MGKLLSKLICCDKTDELEEDRILIHRHTETEYIETNIYNIDELGTAIKFYRLKK